MAVQKCSMEGKVNIDFKKGKNMAIIGQMNGKSFKPEELEHVEKWLIKRGLFATINKEKICVEVSGTVNGKWKEDIGGNLFCVD